MRNCVSATNEKAEKYDNAMQCNANNNRLAFGYKNLLTLEVRSAIAGYLLRQWNVDCSTNVELNGAEYQLRLENTNILQGCSSASVAPGFKDT